ncbi:MAG: hypothetical protein PHY10_01610, partial [Patescibacteria group bacterium]|nr:hypothetical protein [Patescibacteria group bacterium]
MSIIKKHYLKIFIISAIVLCGWASCYSKTSNLGNVINIFPSSFNGDWQNKEAAVNQDLDGVATLENFNNENSASPFVVNSPNAVDSSDVQPLTMIFKKLFSFFRPSSVVAEESNIPDSVLPIAENLIIVGENSTSTPANVSSTSPIIDEVVEAPPVLEETSPILNGEKTLELSNFDLGNQFANKILNNLQLRFSFAGKTTNIGQIQIDYFYQNSWQNAGKLNLESNQEISNATNGGYFLYALPAASDFQFLQDFKIRFIYLYPTDSGEPQDKIFIDSAWLELNYDIAPKIDISITGNKNFLANENPEFTLSGISEENILDKIKGLFGQDKVKTILIDPDHHEEKNRVTVNNNKIIVLKSEQNNFKPGLYKLFVQLNEQGQIVQKEIDFRWGVLAINSDQSIYMSNEKAYLQMAVLTDSGRTICNGHLRLEIQDPQLNTQTFTTEDDSIQYSDTCGPNNVTDYPDYFTYYSTKSSGEYKMKLVNLDNGYEINDTFEVKNSSAFKVERVGAIRINPFYSTYVMHLNLTAKSDFNGNIIEQVPEDFVITGQEGMDVEFNNGFKNIIWSKKIAANETINLFYEYQAPKISPQFYLLGPLKIYDRNNLVFSETRKWQIAADATNMLLFWAGSGGSCSGAGAPPSGWTLVSDGSFTATFPRGDETYGSNEGGSADHTHSATATSDKSNNSTTKSGGGGSYPDYNHTHSVTINSVNVSNSLPLYKDLCVIKLSAGGIPSGSTAIPQNTITIFDAAPPAGWSDYSSTFGTYFIRGNTTPGGSAGSNTHASGSPTGHLISGTLEAVGGFIKANQNGSLISTDTHTHTLSVYTTDTPNIEPLSQNVYLGQKTSSNGPLVTGMIVMFDGDPGLEWDIKSDGSDDFATKYIKVTGTYGNNSTGSTIHSHSQIITTSGTNTETTATGSGASGITSHSHSVTVTIQDGTNKNLPPYTDVVIGKYIGNALPAFTSDATCGGSYPCENPASYSSSPTNEGSTVTFYGTATDGNSDQWKLLVCKTDGTSGTDCDGGASDRWCVSVSAVNSGTQNSCAYTTQDSDGSSNIWYAYGCDATGCTATGNQGTGNSGSPFDTNHDPSFSLFSDNSPINPDGVVTFSTTASDSDTSSTVTLYVCKTNSFTAPATCNGGEWCHSSAGASNPSCQYDDSDNIFQDKNWDSYGYIVDDHGFVSSTGGAQGTNSTLVVNNVSPSITASSIALTDSDGSGNLIPKTEQAETSGFYVNFVVTDMNSCLNVSSGDEITSAIVNIYRGTAPSNPGPTSCDISGEYNANHCYPDAYASWNPSCVKVGTCGGSGDSTIEWRCTFPLQYHVDPTVADSQYPNDEWYAAVQATDDNSASSSLTEDDDGNEMDMFLSMDLNTSRIGYGTISPGGTSAGQTTTIEATGNVGIDEYLSGTTMTGTGTPIDIGQQKYHLTTQDFDWDSGGGVALSDTPTEAENNCPKTTIT